jgi:hypothetical protein
VAGKASQAQKHIVLTVSIGCVPRPSPDAGVSRSARKLRGIFAVVGLASAIAATPLALTPTATMAGAMVNAHEMRVADGGAPRDSGSHDSRPVARKSRSALVHPDPLTVTITSISPSTLVPGEPISVSGTITNHDTAAWTEVRTYLVLSPTPLTSEQEITDALESDPASDVGPRIIETKPSRSWDEIPSLPAGQSATYALDIPYRQLGISGQEGIYWLAVHVIGTDPTGARPGTADARARTFIPLVSESPKPKPVQVCILWPIVSPVRQRGSGVLLDDRLGGLMEPDGRLDRMVSMGRSAQSTINWLIDPALLRAAHAMARGYQVNALQPADGDTSEPAPGEHSNAGKVFADNLVGATTGREQYALPFGDIDVGAVVHAHRGRVLETATATSRQVLADNGVQAVTLNWPPDGQADKAMVLAASRTGSIASLLSSDALPQWSPRTGSLIEVQGVRTSARAVVYDANVFEGGPGPGDVNSALQVRQRLLTEAALHVLAGHPPESLVVVPPRPWDPGPDWSAAGFFSGLKVPWLRLTSLGDTLSQRPVSYTGQFTYSAGNALDELKPPLVDSVSRLRRASTTLISLLTNSGHVQSSYDRMTSLDLSVNWRNQAATVAQLIAGQTAHARGRLAHLSVQSAQSVTLSSSNGRFPVTVSNGLDRAVTVSLSAKPADPALTLTVPKPITIEAGEKVQLQVQARSDRVGLTTVSLRLQTSDGRTFGNARQLSVRTTQYGVVGWIIVGVGCAVLFGTATRRIVRRIRSRNAEASG